MTLDLASLLIASQPPADELVASISTVRVDLAAGIVGELRIELEGKPTLPGTGTQLSWRDMPMTVAGHGMSLGTGAPTSTIIARSSLARAMRATYRPGADRDLSPSQWATLRARAHGGTAITQASASREHILTRATPRQSELDVLASLGAATGWTWVEYDAALRFGSRWWAYTNPDAVTHEVTWAAGLPSDALAADLERDTDDTDDTATGLLNLPYQMGAQLRPWHLVNLDGFDEHDGVWLVERVTLTADTDSFVQVHISRPSPPAIRTDVATGTVTRTGTGLLHVAVPNGGAELQLRGLTGHYTPGDRVLLVQAGEELVALGPITSTPAT